jgi:hypothetical protein
LPAASWASRSIVRLKEDEKLKEAAGAMKIEDPPGAVEVEDQVAPPMMTSFAIWVA